jgi:hypothetical protein
VREALEAAGRRIASGGSHGFQDHKGVRVHGVEYKALPYIDQTKVCVGAIIGRMTDTPAQMYSAVYQKLKEGGCIGIFPEGGRSWHSLQLN